MNINVSSSVVSYEIRKINNSKKILIAGKASSSLKAREILNPLDKEEALSLYGEGDLYKAYCMLYDLNVPNIYTVNCFADSDYIRLLDKLIQYDFDYFVPLNIYLSDTFYNPIANKNEYYVSYFLSRLDSVDSLTTVIMTERHASLYEDFDQFMLSMINIENDFVNSYSFNKYSLLNKYGNNLNFVYNTLENIPFANVVLGALYCNRNYAQYFNSLNDMELVHHIDNSDVVGLRAMYFKYNSFKDDVTIENTFNFRQTDDIYSNALIDDTIKRVIKEVDLSEYKGRLYNPYLEMQIEMDVKKRLDNLKGRLFKDYNIESISFKKVDRTSGYIVVNYTIKPYGTLEDINIIMGVI